MIEHVNGNVDGDVDGDVNGRRRDQNQERGHHDRKDPTTQAHSPKRVPTPPSARTSLTAGRLRGGKRPNSAPGTNGTDRTARQQQQHSTAPR
ncbi:hypothetical protein HETIRDRAFT_409241 [Heterobasidion irregulare TC 32-1]|uniref:Uncharacterized protein n=1 Tax=Heterobasidion irregulare (strain TC 32-1) TaxID=747525 RepID=W4KC77_HETIT|nr:uncharacterized protein HETIRDRAFT_409241 [Heterobasidion irregulare TC 32-1]ETW83472.1 hypothetical protein HETIRDRAFT_409241 [Heterobasidion irregulare TC 32-1]